MSATYTSMEVANLIGDVLDESEKLLADNPNYPMSYGWLHRRLSELVNALHGTTVSKYKLAIPDEQP